MAKYVKTEDGYKEIEAINSNKMDKNNPVGTGSFSMGRKYGSLIGLDSHAEGNNTTASGPYSHSEGHITTASGNGSHAEGASTTASGNGSHAEGASTTAKGEFSHAEGNTTTASSNCSHAEGFNTTASGNYSHAEGANTTASGSHQHVQGKYNVKDSSNKYAHIVGNGTNNSARSNAHTLDWNGVPWFKGRPQFGGTAQDQGSQTVVANGDKELILKSSTTNSTKKFKITVDDDYNVSATNTSDSVSKTLATTEYVDSSVSKSNPLNITGATVGQIAKITAVDDTGKPTAWQAVDMPSGGGGASYRSWSKVWTLEVAEDIAGFAASDIDLDGKSEIMIVFISDSTSSRTMVNGRLRINGVDAGKVLFNSLPLRKDSHSFVIVGRADNGIEYTTMAASAEYQTYPWQGEVKIVHRMVSGTGSIIQWTAGSTIEITQASATLGQGITIEIYVR